MDKPAPIARISWTGGIDPAPPGPSVGISPEGPSDTNGCDRIKAHVLGRFLRALSIPARPMIRAWLPCSSSALGLVALAAARGDPAQLRARLPRRPAACGRRRGLGRRGGPARRGRRRRLRPRSTAASTATPSSRTRTTGRSSFAGRPSPGARRDRARLDDASTPGSRLSRSSFAEGLDEIGVDGGALADGLVIMPRESVGEARDLGRPDRGRHRPGCAGAAARRAGLDASSTPPSSGVPGSDARRRGTIWPPGRAGR